MANFIGGSAPAMASQIAQGLTALSPNSLRSFSPVDLNALKQEVEKLLRQARAELPPQDDSQASQLRNRKIARIGSALNAINGKLLSRR
jgi:hypothetical protein